MVLGYIHVPQTLHRYNYTINSPINLIDPTGHIPPVAFLVAVGVGAFLGSIISDVVAGEPIDWGDAIGWGIGAPIGTLILIKLPWVAGTAIPAIIGMSWAEGLTVGIGVPVAVGIIAGGVDIFI